MLAREEARLRALFRKLMRHVAVASVGTLAVACSAGDDDDAPADGGATNDATLGRDAGDANAPILDACDTLVFVDAPSDGSNCEYFQQFRCGLPAIVREGLDASRSGCAINLGYCYAWCRDYPVVNNCNVVECDDAGNLEETDGAVTIDCVNGIPQCTGTVGRRPKGLCPSTARASRDPVAAWLAECARLEAASVRAFRDLRDELEALGAPRELVRAAKRSAWDEVRHARVMARLARARGANVARVVIARRKRAPHVTEETRAERLLALALENAVEGCVRETFGAFVATRQAAHAKDARVARAMRGIARDETRHAALAWGVAKWVEGELGDGGRIATTNAIDVAIRRLSLEVRATDASVGELGVPAGLDGLALVSAFARVVIPGCTSSVIAS